MSNKAKVIQGIKVRNEELQADKTVQRGEKIPSSNDKMMGFNQTLPPQRGDFRLILSSQAHENVTPLLFSIKKGQSNFSSY